MKKPLAYLNGQFVPFAEAALPLSDAGFVSGATVVDNARTFRHKLFRWSDHLARFRRDCTACHVPLEASDGKITRAAEELVEHNAKLLPPGGELQLVTYATPGPLGFYTGDANNGPPTLGMVTYPLPFARYRRFFTDGVTLAVAGAQHSDPDDVLPPRVKHRSRMVWHVAEKMIGDPKRDFHVPGAVPVVFSQKGFADTAVGCVRAVLGDIVIRPSPDTVLDSISAKVISELCPVAGLKCVEEPLDFRYFYRPPRPNEKGSVFARVSELLLAGTGFGVAGVKRFVAWEESREYAWPGPVFGKLLDAWSDLVGVDIAKQFTE